MTSRSALQRFIVVPVGEENRVLTSKLHEKLKRRISANAVDSAVDDLDNCEQGCCRRFDKRRRDETR